VSPSKAAKPGVVKVSGASSGEVCKVRGRTSRVRSAFQMQSLREERRARLAERAVAAWPLSGPSASRGAGGSDAVRLEAPRPRSQRAGVRGRAMAAPAGLTRRAHGAQVPICKRARHSKQERWHVKEEEALSDLQEEEDEQEEGDDRPLARCGGTRMIAHRDG